MTFNIFQDLGYKRNPFNPIGVPQALVYEDVPPPIGVKKQLGKIKKALDTSINYSSNMIFLVIGEYGTGKSELMKYLYRILKKEGRCTHYTLFGDEGLRLLNPLKQTMKKKPEGKNVRSFTFIDEIDDIKRSIFLGKISTNEAMGFSQDLRKFLERNPPFENIDRNMLVLGLGVPSYDYIDRVNPDITRSRLVGLKAKLHKPEDWQILGFLRRRLYFHGNSKIREKIRKKIPIDKLDEVYDKIIEMLKKYD